MNAKEAISALDADRKAHEAVFQSPKVGEPVYLKSGFWALVSEVTEKEVCLRFKDGSQICFMHSEFPTRRTAMPFILYERTLP